MLSVEIFIVILNVVMLSVASVYVMLTMLSVAFYCYAECRTADSGTFF